MTDFTICSTYLLPQPVQQNRSCKRKRIAVGTMEIDPKIQKYVIQFQRGDVVKWLNTPSALYQIDWLIAIINLRLKTSTVDGSHFSRL